MFEEVLKTIENSECLKLADKLIKTIPEYFYKVPASSTGKYHPDYALGEGGLYRHTLAACRFLNHMLNLEMFNRTLDSRKRDLMRIAMMYHDAFKSGTQEEYEKSSYTKHTHPVIAANHVKEIEWSNSEDLVFLSDCISTHMGQWNTDKSGKITLPKPATLEQNIVHLCDYLASRKDLSVIFENEINKIELKPEDYIMTFGKHKGEKLKDIPKEYLQWALDNTDLANKEPLSSNIKSVLKLDKIK